MILSERYYRKEEFPKDKTVHELFLEQVHRTPDHVALVYQEQSMTYQELNDKAEALAEVLVEKGVVEDKIVSILIEQSIDLMVSILGVLKAGGAFLVIDASYPASRIEFMMDNSDSKLAEMLLQGLNMGIIEGRRLINQKDEDPKVKEIMQEYVDMQEEYVEEIKDFL